MSTLSGGGTVVVRAQQTPEAVQEVQQIQLREAEGGEAQVLGILMGNSPDASPSPPPQVSPVQQRPRQPRLQPSNIPSQRPTVADLPALDRPLEATSIAFQNVWDETRDYLAAPGPRAPNHNDGPTWTKMVVRPWIENRSVELRERIQSALQLDMTEPLHRVVAPALAGLMYLDFAVGLWNAPIPPELAHQPDHVAIYRDALADVIEPILRQSHDAFRRCASEAQTAGGPWTPWQSFCSARAGTQ